MNSILLIEFCSMITLEFETNLRKFNHVVICPLYSLIKAKRILGIRQDSTPKEQQPQTHINKPILKKIDFCSLPWHNYLLSSFPIHFSALFNPSDRSARNKISSISSRCFLNCAWIIQTVIWLFNVSEKLDPLTDSSGQINSNILSGHSTRIALGFCCEF